ncbi:type I-E CRISPR-associated protein Cas6/Cse3/CasE [Nocardiopsis sp. B62]|uniref:type I-E CRISPR-associated protein Cas6/Cse3/CasE n=1 Tax=Nocardiopsis sp. B62 TaxID=2824874 RepID=UPI001B36677A|nr:type I-E CRISPR-associated protein Cas6/Cse3/CasE [Nocardiopsis sp. B62]MBQ1082191.1 type I-E CRISPR-associated protein Cas6/Cse3/CasE [Nocardiopsis sp. B62]
MYLSRVPVNPLSPAFRRDYADVHDMHRTLMARFPEAPDGVPAREHQDLLWRLEGQGRELVMYVQSRDHPNWGSLPEGYLSGRALVRSLGPVLSAVTDKAEFSFRLTANPTRSVSPPYSGQKRPRGVRRPIHDPELQVQWLVRQGERHGFALLDSSADAPDVVALPRPPAVGYKKAPENSRGPDRLKITVASVTFDGRLRVTDPEAFRAALGNGIGRAKAYGCGLLSLAPARRAG